MVILYLEYNGVYLFSYPYDVMNLPLAGISLIFCWVIVISCVSGGKFLGISVSLPVLQRTYKWMNKNIYWRQKSY